MSRTYRLFNLPLRLLRSHLAYISEARMFITVVSKLI